MIKPLAAGLGVLCLLVTLCACSPDPDPSMLPLPTDKQTSTVVQKVINGLKSGNRDEFLSSAVDTPGAAATAWKRCSRWQSDSTSYTWDNSTDPKFIGFEVTIPKSKTDGCWIGLSWDGGGKWAMESRPRP